MDERSSKYESLKNFSLKHGVSLFGVADITGIKDEFLLPREVRDKFQFAISLGKRLIDSVIEEIKDKPTPLYFHHYRQLNFFLDRVAFLVSSFIQELGFLSLPIPASQIVDWERQRGHLSHKKVAYLAGLGWIGRNNLLVNPKLGSRFRLVTVLTDMPLLTDSPLNLDCGDCMNCLSSCPVQAIKEKKEDFDHKGCYALLNSFRRSHIVSQHICGICVKACPGKNRV